MSDMELVEGKACGITLEGFIQVSTKIGSFFCRRAELLNNYVRMYGPNIVTLQMVEDKKTGNPQRVWNKDKTDERYFANNMVISIDLLNPVNLDKAAQEIYETLSGIKLA